MAGGMWRVVLVGAAAAKLGSGPASAQEVGLVVHAPAGAPSAAGPVRAALVRAAVRAGAHLEGRPFSRAAALLASGAVRAERLDRFARVERLAGEGWRGYLEARFTAAVARLEEARTESAALVDLAGGLEVYADLCLRLAAVELALGRDRDAELDFRLAALLDPDRAVSDAEFKPAVVDRHRVARTGTRTRWRRQVETDPPGATLELDGQAIGTAPIELELEEGRHVLVARSPGRSARADVIAVEAGGGPVIRFRLDEDRLAAAAMEGAAGMRVGQGDTKAAAAAEALVVIGELDGILVVASIWRRGRPALLGQFCSGAPLDCGRLLEIGYGRREELDRAAAELWRETQRVGAHFPLRLLADVRLVHREPGPSEPSGADDAETRRGRWWESRWLWLGVGGAALSAVAAGLALTSGDDPLRWTASFDGCEFGGCPSN